MSISEVRSAEYRVSNEDISVEWASYDFTKDVAAIPNAAARTVLLEAGVMYVPTAEPAIRVSHLLSPEIQGLSALHEDLCMSQKIADCPDVEEMVIDSIEDPGLENAFVATRLRMFGALCVIDASNESFSETRQLLLDRLKTTYFFDYF